MNISSLTTMNYKIFIPLAGEKNKANSNPTKPNLRKAKMNVNSLITKGYRKNDDFTVRINKPNLRNGQNERKLNFNKGLQKKRLFSSPKNKPNSNPISSKAKIACRKIRPHPPFKVSCFFLDLNFKELIVIFKPGTVLKYYHTERTLR